MGPILGVMISCLRLKLSDIYDYLEAYPQSALPSCLRGGHLFRKQRCPVLYPVGGFLTQQNECEALRTGLVPLQP